MLNNDLPKDKSIFVKIQKKLILNKVWIIIFGYMVFKMQIQIETDLSGLLV